MTGGRQSSWIMRPLCFWNSLQPAILAVLCLTLKADNKEPGCISEIKVRRFTTYDAVIGQELKITCPVTFCKSSPPKVSWVKSEGAGFLNVSTNAHIRTEWKNFDQSEGRSYLIFQSILRKDAGVYRCEVKGSVGHNVNVSVHGDVGPSSGPALSSPPLQQRTNSTSESPTALDTFCHYLYHVIGILALSAFVTVVCVASKKCKGKNKKIPDPPHHIYDNDL